MLYKYLPASIRGLNMKVENPRFSSNFDLVSECILVPSFPAFGLKAIT